jgi:hypothetical protein
VVVVVLHDTLYELNRANDKGVDKPCKCSILNAVKHTESIFFHKLFISFIASINDSVDDGDSDDWVVHSIEESHEALVFDNFFELIHHGKVGLKLHSDFEGVEDVAGDAISDSGKTAIEEVDCPVSHLIKLWP